MLYAFQYVSETNAVFQFRPQRPDRIPVDGCLSRVRYCCCAFNYDGSPARHRNRTPKTLGPLFQGLLSLKNRSPK